VQTLHNEDNHDPIDLELTLDTGPRREKRKKSGCNDCGEEDDNGGDQEVESSATGRLSLSLLSSAPARTSTGSDRKVLGLDLDRGEKHVQQGRSSTLDLTLTI
jgi:hypothetical protein